MNKLTPFRDPAVLASVVTASAGPCNLGGYYIGNPNDAPIYLHFYDVAGSVTVGTTVPTLTILLPALAAANIEFANGIKFTNALKIAATTGVSGNTAPGTGLVTNLLLA